MEKIDRTKLIAIEKGKIPPQAVDMEEAVLGAMMIDKQGIQDVLEILQEEVFYEIKHQQIFKAIKTVYMSNDAVDLLTVSNELKKMGSLDLVGGDFHLIRLTQKVASSAHIEFHSRIILQKYMQRQMINNSGDIIEQAYQDDVDVFDVIDNAYNHLNTVSEVAIKPREIQFVDTIESVIDLAKKIKKGEIKAGIETPITKLTEKTGGFRDGELIIMAARPGMGKTSLAIKTGIHNAKQNIPVAIFSLEMNNKKITSRILSMEYKIPLKKFITNGLTDDESKPIEDDTMGIKTLPLYIDDTPSLSIMQFQIKAKRLVRKHKVKLLIVDYLQLMSGDVGKGNREQEIAKISRGLKKTAMDLNIPVIALSQLSRAVETRGGMKRPNLSDLRESGAIEQDADMVMFIYRPEYYGITEWDDDYNNEDATGQAEYLVEKNRNGAITRGRMNFDSQYTLFSDLKKNVEQIPMQQIPDSVKGITPQEAFGNPKDDDTDDLPF